MAGVLLLPWIQASLPLDTGPLDAGPSDTGLGVIGVTGLQSWLAALCVVARILWVARWNTRGKVSPSDPEGPGPRRWDWATSSAGVRAHRLGLLFTGLVVVVAAGAAFFARAPGSVAAACLLTWGGFGVLCGVPASLENVMGWARKRQVRFDSFSTLETAGQVRHVALGLRHSLARSTMHVDVVHPVPDHNYPRALARWVALQGDIDHPITRALQEHLQERLALKPPSRERSSQEAQSPQEAHSIQGLEFIPGRGVRGTVDGVEMVLGNRQHLLACGVSIAVWEADAQRIEASGATALFAAQAGRLQHILGLRYDLDAAARHGIQRMDHHHLETVLLSGEHAHTLEVLGKRLGIHAVRADLTVPQRAQALRRISETTGPVAYVGRPGAEPLLMEAADIRVILAPASPIASGGAVGGSAHKPGEPHPPSQDLAEGQRPDGQPPEGQRSEGPRKAGAVYLGSGDLRDVAFSIRAATLGKQCAQDLNISTLVAVPMMVTGAALGFLSPWLAALLALGLELLQGARLQWMARRIQQLP